MFGYFVFFQNSAADVKVIFLAGDFLNTFSKFRIKTWNIYNYFVVFLLQKKWGEILSVFLQSLAFCLEFLAKNINLSSLHYIFPSFSGESHPVGFFFVFRSIFLFALVNDVL